MQMTHELDLSLSGKKDGIASESFHRNKSFIISSVSVRLHPIHCWYFLWLVMKQIRNDWVESEMFIIAGRFLRSLLRESKTETKWTNSLSHQRCTIGPESPAKKIKRMNQVQLVWHSQTWGCNRLLQNQTKIIPPCQEPILIVLQNNQPSNVKSEETKKILKNIVRFDEILCSVAWENLHIIGLSLGFLSLLCTGSNVPLRKECSVLRRGLARRGHPPYDLAKGESVTQERDRWWKPLGNAPTLIGTDDCWGDNRKHILCAVLWKVPK